MHLYVFFGAYLENQDIAFSAGYLMIMLTSLTIVFDLGFVFFFGLRSIYLLLLRYWNKLRYSLRQRVRSMLPKELFNSILQVEGGKQNDFGIASILYPEDLEDFESKHLPVALENEFQDKETAFELSKIENDFLRRSFNGKLKFFDEVIPQKQARAFNNYYR
mmetsp:Transcript_1089/g.1279  ORF Transcript_1089/g.1279 Transcript_1089/m.1279 type:complete len:162 (-) Transcript_1089:217-702(-)